MYPVWRGDAGRVKHTALPGTVVYCNGLAVLRRGGFAPTFCRTVVMIGFAGPIRWYGIRLASTLG